MARPKFRGSTLDAQLADFVGGFADNPLGFVRACYPWGEPGTTLEHHTGPDVWQAQALEEIGAQVRERHFNFVDPVDPIRDAWSSGHGIGKSVLTAWLVDWIASTRPMSQGTVTANTFTQLQSKTWAAIQRWTRLCLTGHWFDVGASRITSKQFPESWFLTAQTCREENSEAFAGQHAADSTSYYVVDEASAVPDGIWEVIEGGLTDGEPMVFAFGNPTRNTGKFHRAVFGSERGRWKHHIIDSRTCRFTNKKLIAEWIEDYGEDSDFVRVRVRGLAPSASDMQFIDSERVYAAQKRPALCLPDDPLVVGLDIARGGLDNCVFRFRRGLDARRIPPIKIPGEQIRDSMRLVSIAAELLGSGVAFEGQKIRVAMMFIDETGIGGPIVDRLRQLGHGERVCGVQFGAKAPDRHHANMRTHIWAKAKDWLVTGAIDSDPQLEADLTGPGYGHDKHDRLLLESKESMKERDLASPDDGDALALTLTHPVVASTIIVAPPTPAIVVAPSPLGWMS